MSIFRRLGQRITGTTAPPAPPPALPTPPPVRSPGQDILARAQKALRSDVAASYARGRAMDDAQQLLTLGETGLARTLLTEAVAEHASPEARALLVKVLRLRGEVGPAIQLLRVLALEQSHAVDAELQLAELHENTGDIATARRHYERALALEPGHHVARERARKLRGRLEGTLGLPPETWRAMGRLWGEAAAGARYKVVDEVGRGGAATLFAAQEQPGGRTVALKVFHPRGDPVLRQDRILREATLAARAAGPGVVPILDAVPQRDLVVMPFYAEGSLRSLLGQGRLPPVRALRLLRDTALILARLHAAGSVHLDLKPSNILLDAGQPVLADFGAAAARALGQAAGTPPYLAPEVTRDEPVDARADLFALGVMLVELFTGAPAVHASALSGVTGPLGEGVRHVAARLLEDEPHRRAGSASEVAEMLAVLVGVASEPA